MGQLFPPRNLPVFLGLLGHTLLRTDLRRPLKTSTERYRQLEVSVVWNTGPNMLQAAVTGQGGVQEQDSRERKARLEQAGNKRVHGRDGSGTRGNDCVLDRRSKIQDIV